MIKPLAGLAALTLSAAVALPAAAQNASVGAAVVGSALAQYGGDWRPGPGWDRDIDVRCASQGYSYQMCQVDTGRGSNVRIVRQISNSACIEGRTWGWNRAGIWVDGGCEAIFRVKRRWTGGPGHGHGPGPGPGPGPWQPGPGWDARIRVRCESRDFNYNMCQVDTGRGSRVWIENQLSNTRCVEGRNWGWNRAGVWVDQGCAAIFIVDRRWR